MVGSLRPEPSGQMADLKKVEYRGGEMGYPVTPTCWEDELGFHHSSSRAVGGQADMTEKSGEDYLTSGNLTVEVKTTLF